MSKQHIFFWNRVQQQIRRKTWGYRWLKCLHPVECHRGGRDWPWCTKCGEDLSHLYPADDDALVVELADTAGLSPAASA